VTDDADANYRAGRIDAAAKTAAYSLASDVRAAAYADAEQRHRDRMAAIQRYFEQLIVARGHPATDHALAFVETVADPEGLFAPVAVELAQGEVVTTIAYNGIRRQVRIDGNGRVAAHVDAQTGDGWSRRGTFVGDAEAFMAAKRAGVSTPEEPPPAPRIPPPPMIRADRRGRRPMTDQEAVALTARSLAVFTGRRSSASAR